MWRIKLGFIFILYFLLSRLSLCFTVDGLALFWPSNGLYVGYLINTSAYTSRFFVVVVVLTLNYFLSVYKLYTDSMAINLSLTVAVYVPLTAWVAKELVGRFGFNNQGNGGSEQRPELKSNDTNNIHDLKKIDLRNVRHTMLLFASLLIGPAIGATLAHCLFLPMRSDSYILWLFSEYAGNLLMVPFVLLLDEVPKQFRQWRAVWTFAVLAGINSLYVALRLLNAADTALGLYLNFPWLLLMTAMFGAPGAYTGCFVAGMINGYTVVWLDDATTFYDLCGRLLILVFTCAAFVEVFRQRDEALTHVEGIVQERTARLTEAVSQLMRAEQKTLSALESRTRFIRYLCHELRNPLHQISNLTDLLANDVPNEEVNGVVDDIVHAASYMMGFIQDILELRQIEAPVPRTTDDEGLVSANQAASFLRSRFTSSSIHVETQLDEDIQPLQIPMSKSRFSNMSQRLISYVRAFNPDRRLTLSFSACSNDRTCRIQTSHHASITSEDDLRELVMPFSTRAKDSWVPEYEGSGLCLAIVRQIVERAGGRIYLRSIVNQNRVISTIILPLSGTHLPPGDLVQVEIDTTVQPSLPNPGPSKHIEVEDQPHSHHQQNQPHHTNALDPPPTIATNAPTITPPPSPRKVLVVDDSCINRKILARIFQNLNFEVIEAADGQAAVDAYRPIAESIVIVMMDVNMPVMDGFQATRLLREMGCEVPIVAVTGNLVQDDEVYYRVGFTEIAPKPFLKKHAQDVVRRYRLQEGLRVDGCR
ncbi:hypothetical protein HK102_010138 [Quaeritorhiza haematococci]|nr:hypothetical protein HK102_010138 [Quaeritorhiza haematococci]